MYQGTLASTIHSLSCTGDIMYIDYPQNIEVVTPCGLVYLAITDGNHVYVDANRDGRTVTIGGKPIRFTAHLKFRDGQWAEDKDSAGRLSLYAKKANVNTMNDGATDTQKSKIRDVVFPVIIQFILERPELIKQAQAAHVNNTVDSLEEEIRLLQLQINEKLQEIASLLTKT